MAQFHIYRNANVSSRKNYPYLLDAQSPLLDALETRLVIPLSGKIAPKEKRIQELNPTVIIEKKDYVLLTQQLAAIPQKQLGAEVAFASENRQEIIDSIDFLITGF